jgi:hypothetical protein
LLIFDTSVLACLVLFVAVDAVDGVAAIFGGEVEMYEFWLDA